MAGRSGEWLSTRDNAIFAVNGASSTSKGHKGRVRFGVDGLGVERHFWKDRGASDEGITEKKRNQLLSGWATPF